MKLPPEHDIDIKFLREAVNAARGSGCMRRKVGAVLVQSLTAKDSFNVTLRYVTAYNAPPPGVPTCEARGGCVMAVNPETGREGCANTIHAEINVIKLAHDVAMPTEGSTLYVDTKPCFNCAKVLALYGVSRVVYLGVNEETPEALRPIVAAVEFVQIDMTAYHMAVGGK